MVDSGDNKQKSAQDLTSEGLTFARNGQIDAALAKFLEAVKVDPSHVQAYINIGMCYRDTQPQKAIEACTQAIKLAPTGFPQAYINRAISYKALGQLREAINDYQTLQQDGRAKQLDAETDVNQQLIALRARLLIGDEAITEFADVAQGRSAGVRDRQWETAIATAASTGGLAILRRAVIEQKINLSPLIRKTPGKPGLFVEKVNEYGEELMTVFFASCWVSYIDPGTGWNDPVPAQHKLRQTPAELAHNIEKMFIGVADKYQVKPENRPLLAVLATMQVLLRAKQAINPEVSKAIIVTSLVGASKSIPFD